ncbi:unnamed protein product [Ixodes pacificus]
MEIDRISTLLDEILTPLGIESHPFKIQWYNDRVPGAFKFQRHPDTLCFVSLSTPSTFEKAFLPFVLNDRNLTLKDPFDQCMTACFARAIQAFPGESVELLQDFELHPNRRPKVIMQTAGHVSGAVHYYGCNDMEITESPPNKKLLGVCIHPKYGGWFAFRGVFIFGDVLVPDLEQRQPADVVQCEDVRRDLLRLFNFSWQNGRYRDVIHVDERYSARQQEYFRTVPSQRWELIEQWRNEARTRSWSGVGR